MGQSERRHRPRSPLSGIHPLARPVQVSDVSRSALQVLRDAFPPVPESLASAIPADEHWKRQAAQESTPGNLIVPRTGLKIPLHVLGTNRQHPWDLLPARAAAMQQYPNLFGETAMFFGSIKHAVLHNMPSRLIKPSKVALHLAKMMRNLGIIAGFEVVQRLQQVPDHGYAWPPGEEPEDYVDLDLHRGARLKLNLRWDAYRPVWESPSAPVAQAPLHTADPLPFSTRTLSRPSCPMVVAPEELNQAMKEMPPGVVVMWEPRLGLTLDPVTSHYGLRGLALAHVGLPWSQVAQIRGALRAKADAEQGLPLEQHEPLYRWSLVDWTARTLQSRATQLGPSSPQAQAQVAAIQKAVRSAADKDKQVAGRGLALGEELHRELVAWSLRDKFGQIEPLYASMQGAGAASGLGSAAGAGDGSGATSSSSSSSAYDASSLPSGAAAAGAPGASPRGSLFGGGGARGERGAGAAGASAAGAGGEAGTGTASSRGSGGRGGQRGQRGGGEGGATAGAGGRQGGKGAAGGSRSPLFSKQDQEKQPGPGAADQQLRGADRPV